MSAAILIPVIQPLVLPFVWAMEDLTAVSMPRPDKPDKPNVRPNKPLARGVGFYRRYTEAILRRYVKMSMEAGRAPSLLGREMFRGKVTSYRVHSFEDVVIFVHDVERCLEKLDEEELAMIQRIAMQEYTFPETAERMGVALATVIRRYFRALDVLTRLLMESRLLESMKSCQGVGSSGIDVSSSLEWR